MQRYLLWVVLGLILSTGLLPFKAQAEAGSVATTLVLEVPIRDTIAIADNGFICLAVANNASFSKAPYSDQSLSTCKVSNKKEIPANQLWVRL